MSIPATGAVSFLDIQTVFGGTPPISMLEYYSNDSSGYTASVTGIPATGNPMSMSNFKGKSKQVSNAYTFTSLAFTNAGASNRYGPTLAMAQSTYLTASGGGTWTQNSNNLNVVNGVQLWRIPASGTYTVTIAGAKGGSGRYGGGNGVSFTSNLSLTENDTLAIIVGQMGEINSYGAGSGNAGGGGGGGGSFIYNNGTGSLLLSAGGGGGGGNGSGGGQAAVITTSALNGAPGGAGGTNGGGGGGGGGGPDAYTGGGTGVNGAGGKGGFSPYSQNFLGGGGGGGGLGNLSTSTFEGGTAAKSGPGYGQGGHGGFGGGGGGGCGGISFPGGGGGGGGYSGGGGGTATGGNAGSGGGGGSFGALSLLSYNTGHGYITITKV